MLGASARGSCSLSACVRRAAIMRGEVVLDTHTPLCVSKPLCASAPGADLPARTACPDPRHQTACDRSPRLALRCLTTQTGLPSCGISPGLRHLITHGRSHMPCGIGGIPAAVCQARGYHMVPQARCQQRARGQQAVADAAAVSGHAQFLHVRRQPAHMSVGRFGDSDAAAHERIGESLATASQHPRQTCPRVVSSLAATCPASSRTSETHTRQQVAAETRVAAHICHTWSAG